MRLKEVLGTGVFLLTVFATVGCQQDSYESGDTKYSYLRADFVEAHSSAVGEFDRCITDDDITLFFSPYATVKWAGTADSVYRALIYYDTRDNDTTDLSSKTVVPISAARVPVLTPKDSADFNNNVKNDPITLESTWISSNGKYLNLGLIYKTGKADEDSLVQSIGICKEAEHDDTVTLRLHHDQGGVPEYYSSRIYTSIPLNGELAGKVIRLKVNTYKGEIEKTYKSSH